MISKLSGTCYAIWLMVHISNINTIKSIYYSYFHSIIKHGIFLLGNSSNSAKIFTLQEKTVRIMAGARPRTLCRSTFKQLEILSLPCKYILSLLNFIIYKQENSRTNSSIHNTVLINFQRITFYAAIKTFNSLPPSLKILKNDRAKFKTALRKYLNTHSFYSVDELFMYTNDLEYRPVKFLQYFTLKKIVYIYVFMTCSTSYCLCDTLIYP